MSESPASAEPTGGEDGRPSPRLLQAVGDLEEAFEEDGRADDEDMTDLLTALRRSVEAAGRRSPDGNPSPLVQANSDTTPTPSLLGSATLTVSLPTADLTRLARLAGLMAANRTTALARAVRLSCYLHDAASAARRK